MDTDEKDSQPFLRQALDSGINFLNTANVYSSGASEEVVGRFLKANIAREDVIIATKAHGSDARHTQWPRPFAQGIIF